MDGWMGVIPWGVSRLVVVSLVNELTTKDVN
jgi:hypothetical protein